MNWKGCDFLFFKRFVSAPGTSALVGLSWFICPFLVCASLCDVWDCQSQHVHVWGVGNNLKKFIYLIFNIFSVHTDLGRKCLLALHMQRKREEPAQTRPMKPPQPHSVFSKGMECSSLVLVPYMREWPTLAG